MEKAIDTLFGNGLFSNIYFVDSNPAKVEFVEVKKINSEIREIKNSQSFDLERHPIRKTGLLSLNIRERVKSSFMSVLDSIPVEKELRYFKRGLIKRLFEKKDPKTLLNIFHKKADWIITSYDVISELTKLEGFVYLVGYSDVRLVGKIGKTLIFKIKDLENVVYMGKKESITPVFNTVVSEEKEEIFIEYLIQANEGLSKIKIR
jgi:hypothetical protein